MAKKKSYVPIAKIKNALRRIHVHCKQRKIVTDRSKVDKATNACELCGDFYYSGTSDKNYTLMVEKYPGINVVKGKLQIDHITPVVDVKKGFTDWTEYIRGVWVGADEMQDICEVCHKKKSAKEMKERTTHGSLKRGKK